MPTAPAPDPHSPDGHAEPIRFHYTLLAPSGAVIARYETEDSLHCGDEVALAGTTWRVVSVLGAMATITRADDA